MDPTTLPEALQEALGIHEGFRKLGFSADDIYLVVNGPLTIMQGPETTCQILVKLKAQDKEFSVMCGYIEDEPETIIELWQQACDDLRGKKMDQEKLDKIWQVSIAHTDAAGFVGALHRKGFVLPTSQN